MVNFGLALQALKDGKRISRSGWNGKGMFAYLVPAASYPVQTGAAKEHFGEGSMVPYRAYFALKTVDEDVAVWVPSVSDILAEDWEILADKHSLPINEVITNPVEMDKIARGSGSLVNMVFGVVASTLHVTDDELNCIRPTVAASVSNLRDEYFGIALLSTMARIKGKHLSLEFTDASSEISIDVDKS